MSKDIWHKAGFHEAIDDKLKVSKDGKWVYWTMYGWNIPGKDAHDIGCEWAYLDDLLALENELERTRKALEIRKRQVDIANKAFDFILTEWDNPDCGKKELMACAFNAKEDIAGWESDIETPHQQCG